MEIEQRRPNEVSLHFLNGPLAEETIHIQKPMIAVGRDRQNDIVVLDPSVSRHHARIVWQQDSWTIENVSQSSYIAIDQQRTQRGTLQHNSMVRLGENVLFTFLIQQPIPLLPQTLPAYSNVSTEHSTLPVEPNILAHIPSTAGPSETILAPMMEIGKRSLTVSSNIHSDTQVHILNKPVLNIGRAPENDIVIADPIVSAWHAQIVRDGNDLFFVHPHPTRGKTLNGVWYQGYRIRADQQFRKQLVNGDTFRIGDEHGTLITLIYDDGMGISSENLPGMQPLPVHPHIWGTT